MENSTEETDTEQGWYVLEEEQVFSQSILWALQQQYFAARGVEAWSKDGLPDYITSNPTAANTYAEIIFAFFRDQSRFIASDEAKEEPLYLCELGAGPGRFAFHFLSRLTRLCQQAGVPTDSFCYVLTDHAESNLAFWRKHPRFQPFFESGLLDVAAFDVTKSTEIALQHSGRMITTGSLRRPLVIIANYVFDCIPQDLFYFNDQDCRQCLVSLSVDEDPEMLDLAGLLARLRWRYHHQALAEPPYDEPWLQQLLAGYQRALTDTHLLIPASGLRCLHRLKALSMHGLFLVSADKGEHRLEVWQGEPPPELFLDPDCFSLDVNFHAIKVFCEQSGGLALFPSLYQDSLQVSCCLMVREAIGYVETRHAYQRYVDDFGPVDFFHVIWHAIDTIEALSVEEILAYLRLSHYDSIPFTHFLPRLMELAPEFGRDEHETVKDAIENVWASYFPLGGALDLANEIAGLLYAMDDYQRALIYFERSMAIYGQDTGTLYNVALCHQMLGDDKEAERLLRTVLHHDPANQQAGAALAAYKA